MAAAKHLSWLWRTPKRVLVIVLLIVGGVATGFAIDEARTSRRQASWLSGQAPELRFEVKPGPSTRIRFPESGPFDERLGYQRLPAFQKRLTEQGYNVTEQARMSERMVELVDMGLFAPYREKTQTGLELRDCRGDAIVQARYPERGYARFEQVPRLLVQSLLFIENRELLDERYPQRNPAIEWDRFGKAIVDQALRRLDDGHSAGGGSTLATQIEKYRHSPEGRTSRAKEKLRQMASASLRAYLDGENTLPRRRQTVVDYLNTVPLSAQTGFGEVNGIGDGLWAWYGRDFDEVNKLLAAPLASASPPQPQQRESLAFKAALLPQQALAYKQALSLLVAQRRPSWYMADGTPELRRLTDAHLRVLADAGVIPAALRDAALPLPLAAASEATALRGGGSFVERKASTALRTRLQGLLAVPRSYDVDRLDLSVDSPLDGRLQQAATNLLRGLADPRAARAAGLFGFRLLGEGDDTSKIMFSFTLYERGAHANLLRVQTDSFDQPFDINDGARLDLGSTSKLRTLVTYLERIAALHERWHELSADELKAIKIGSRDVLSRWAREYLQQAAGAEGRDLRAMLEAALDRTYSANPGEGFFTGGGLHYFENFEPEDNVRTMTVREALTRSVNLVFIRLMRDIVYHEMTGREAERAELLDDPTSTKRQEYLARFADKEGREFLARFHRKYMGKSPEESEALLVQTMRPTTVRLAAAFFELDPDGDEQQLGAFLARHLPRAPAQSELSLANLREKYGAGRWSIGDRGYLANVHPLELWLVGQLRRHPKATFAQLAAASADERQDVYQWLFKTRHKGGQDTRIRQLLEADAFAEILKSWKRVGYPFEALTPSYASALGASGDRPAALAELMGIIVNRGKRLPTLRVGTLQFARGTPYETRFDHRPLSEPKQVLAPEVADALRAALVNVVENGTAKRLKGALIGSDGKPVAIGGKTGTGDHRFDTHDRAGRVLSSRVVNRSATLVFLIGDRWFGTMMAYVHEPYAANYKFTSAMPSQLLKALVPVLTPLVNGEGCGAGGGPRAAAIEARPSGASGTPARRG